MEEMDIFVLELVGYIFEVTNLMNSELSKDFGKEF